MTGIDQNRPVIKYIGLFALAYNIFLGMISIVLSILRESVTGLFYAIAVLGAGRLTAYWFIKENSRLPTKVEKRRLIAGTFLCTIISTGAIGMRYVIYEHVYSFAVMQLLDLPILWYIFDPLSKSIFNKRKQ